MNLLCEKKYFSTTSLNVKKIRQINIVDDNGMYKINTETIGTTQCHSNLKLLNNYSDNSSTVIYLMITFFIVKNISF